MHVDRLRWSRLAGLALVLAGCDGGPSSTSPGDERGGSTANSVKACASGKRGAGEALIKKLRSTRLGEGAGDYATSRQTLREACEAGCSVACLEYARNSWDPGEANDFNRRACEAGEADGCARLTGAEASARAQLCERGDALACSGGDLQVVIERSAKACADNDGRSCSVHGWTRCVFKGECEGEALEAVTKAARLVPEAAIFETLAALQCHVTRIEEANATLAQACSSGLSDTCERSCEQLRPQTSLIVRTAERAAYEELVTLIALQGNIDPGWWPTISAMSVDELAKAQKVIEVFTPALTEDGAKAEVPEEIRTAYPELVAAILRAPQFNTKKIKYWIKRLPEMDDEQRFNLMDSLRNQWWVLPQEGSRSPVDVINDVRWSNGGFGPLPPRE